MFIQSCCPKIGDGFVVKESDLTKEFYRTGEAAKYLNIASKTMYLWTKKGIVNARMSPTGKLQIPREELIRLLKQEKLLAESLPRRDALYARVSSHGQKKGGDLDRQVLEIIESASPYKLYDPLIIKDVGSGLNTERKGLIKLMNEAKDQQIGRIFITHPDRLTRFGFSYLTRYFNIFDVEIITLSEKDDKTPQQELADDLMTLLASFSGKLYRLRKEDRKKLHKKIDEFPEEKE